MSSSSSSDLGPYTAAFTPLPTTLHCLILCVFYNLRKQNGICEVPGIQGTLNGSCNYSPLLAEPTRSAQMNSPDEPFPPLS